MSYIWIFLCGYACGWVLGVYMERYRKHPPDPPSNLDYLDGPCGTGPW